jgi:predicted DsbA family dithiol-disulfide isomerase
LEAEYDVEVEWLPVEIHPEVPEEGLDWPPYLRASFGGMSDLLMEEAHKAGLLMVVPEIIPKSRRALEAAEYAREKGRHPEFHEIVFRRFYGEGENLASWDMLRAAALESGLDPDEMQQKTEFGLYAAYVDKQMTRLIALGATGVPLFIFDNKIAILGLRPFEAFQEVMEHLENEQ